MVSLLHGVYFHWLLEQWWNVLGGKGQGLPEFKPDRASSWGYGLDYVDLSMGGGLLRLLPWVLWQV